MLLPRDYSLIFWGFGRHDPVAIIRRTNAFFRRFGDAHVPQLLAGIPIPPDDDALGQLLKDWGSEVSLSVGLTSRSGVALKILTVTRVYENVTFPDALIIGFHAEQILGMKPGFSLDRLVDIFAFGVDVFQPFYGYGGKSGEVNYAPSRTVLSRKVDTTRVPIVIEWFNYFSPEWVERLGGRRKLLNAPAWHVAEHDESGGVVLVLQEEAFDYENAAHLQNRARVEDYLGLALLHQRYPRGHADRGQFSIL